MPDDSARSSPADVLVTAATGQVGSEVAAALVRAGVRTRVLVRDGGEARLPGTVRDAARIHVGTLTDGASVRAAAAGATGIFVALPPDGGTADLRAFWRTCVSSITAAADGVDHAVVLSSQGAAEGGSGLLGALFDAEHAIATAIPNTRALRSGPFMENLIPSAPALAGGVLPFPMAPDAPAGLVATRDLGALAARLLGDPVWTGHDAFGVYGPSDLTMSEAARILTRVLGFPVRHERTAVGDVHAELLAAGMSADAAELATRMFDDMSRRTNTDVDPRTREGTMPTDLASFARDVLVPAVRAAA